MWAFGSEDWPPEWLRLRPRNLVAGMGCHKGLPVEALLAFIRHTFEQEKLSLLCLKALATIEAKKDEPGLRMAARSLGVEFLWFTATELKDIPVPNPSPRVARHMQVASVSEAAALKAGGVELIVTKQKSPNATLAVARVACGSEPGAGSPITSSPGLRMPWPRPSGGGLPDLYRPGAPLVDDSGSGGHRDEAEVKRCQLALDRARAGQKVALVSSGDAGIYGMPGWSWKCAPSRGSVGPGRGGGR